MSTKRARSHRIGMRIIKTVVAVFLCGLLGFLREQSAFHSMIAAIVCLQTSTGKTIESSLNRVLATVAGGAAGIIVVYALNLLNLLQMELVCYAVYALMLIPLICFTLAIKRPNISAFTCVVFLCITVAPGASSAPARNALERLIETLIGIALACAVDLILPSRTPAQKQEN